jgi:hypothetical protein
MNNIRIAKSLLFSAVGIALLAVIIGTVFYSVDDGGPAPYMGLCSVILAISSLLFFHKAKHQGTLNKSHKWMYVVACIVIAGLAVYFLIGIVDLVRCTNSTSCQLFAP